MQTSTWRCVFASVLRCLRESSWSGFRVNLWSVSLVDSGFLGMKSNYSSKKSKFRVSILLFKCLSPGLQSFDGLNNGVARMLQGGRGGGVKGGEVLENLWKFITLSNTFTKLLPFQHLRLAKYLKILKYLNQTTPPLASHPLTINKNKSI